MPIKFEYRHKSCSSEGPASETRYQREKLGTFWLMLAGCIVESDNDAGYAPNAPSTKYRRFGCAESEKVRRKATKP